jgi:hypothetical protein
MRKPIGQCSARHGIDDANLCLKKRMRTNLRTIFIVIKYGMQMDHVDWVGKEYWSLLQRLVYCNLHCIKFQRYF